ncbi:MAG: addiction module protein [Elusimicrobia bacterium]|nr:addiction module protein [Elusimicrobiota bacterium]
MRGAALKLQKQVEALPDVEKLHLVNTILSELDKPDPAIDKIWMGEAQRRWNAYKRGKLKAIPYQEVMKRFKAK